MIRFKLSPELADGAQSEITTEQDIILERVKLWLAECADVEGASCSIETVEMTDKEFESLPEM